MKRPDRPDASSDNSFHKRLTEEQWRDLPESPQGDYIGHWCDDDNCYALFLKDGHPRVYSSPLIDRRYFALSRTIRAASIAERLAQDLWGTIPLDAFNDEPILDHNKWRTVWPMSRRALPAAETSRTSRAKATALPSHFSPTRQIPNPDILVGKSHHGVQKRLLDRPIDEALGTLSKLADGETISAPLALTQALESCLGVVVAPEIRDARLALLEVERIRVHLGSIMSVAASLELDLIHTHVALALKACDLACIQALGTHHMIGCITFAGVSDPVKAPQIVQLLTSTLQPRLPLLKKLLESTERHFADMAKISSHRAKIYLLSGVNGRANGRDRDLRLISPDPRFNPSREGGAAVGDAWSRVIRRLNEITDSLKYLDTLAGNFGKNLPPFSLASSAGNEGVSGVEGSRGETWCWARCQEGRVTHFHLQTGSLNALPVVLLLCDSGEDEHFIQASFSYSATSAEL